LSLLSLLRYALYLARAAKAYRDEGIAFEHLAIQNEPNQDSSCGAYPKMGWTGEALHEFVRDHLGPTFESEGIAQQVGIFLSTFPVNDFDGFVNPTLNDSSAAKYVSRARPLACNACTLDTYAHAYSLTM
jgi:O-glycosyl hydrolase